LISLVTFS